MALQSSCLIKFYIFQFYVVAYFTVICSNIHNENIEIERILSKYNQKLRHLQKLNLISPESKKNNKNNQFLNQIVNNFKIRRLESQNQKNIDNNFSKYKNSNLLKSLCLKLRYEKNELVYTDLYISNDQSQKGILI